jgi:hypothetical protein
VPVLLKFSLTIDKEICRQNRLKRTPQFAIWLENPQTGEIRTVCVTQKTAAGKWGNNVTRPVALPRWVSRWNRETQSSGDPTAENPAADAVTCATPDEEFSTSVEVLAGQIWECYVEVNVSGDDNERFPPVSADGRKDAHSNGQPSLVYEGTITALPGNKCVPQPVGITDQHQPTEVLNNDLSGITTAAKLFKQIEIACVESPAD